MIVTTRQQRREMKRENSKQPAWLEVIPESKWPNTVDKRLKVWRSKDFLVQAFKERDGMVRLSINRTSLGDNGRWIENITWEELMELKRQAGFGDFYAIEVYPQDKQIVNVANMRHLWVVDNPLNIGWFK